jgi:hypothetical protein
MSTETSNEASTCAAPKLLPRVNLQLAAFRAAREWAQHHPVGGFNVENDEAAVDDGHRQPCKRRRAYLTLLAQHPASLVRHTHLV